MPPLGARADPGSMLRARPLGSRVSTFQDTDSMASAPASAPGADEARDVRSASSSISVDTLSHTRLPGTLQHHRRIAITHAQRAQRSHTRAGLLATAEHGRRCTPCCGVACSAIGAPQDCRRAAMRGRAQSAARLRLSRSGAADGQLTVCARAVAGPSQHWWRFARLSGPRGQTRRRACAHCAYASRGASRRGARRACPALTFRRSRHCFQRIGNFSRPHHVQHSRRCCGRIDMARAAAIQCASQGAGSSTRPPRAEPN
jgi:hypothetical protein